MTWVLLDLSYLAYRAHHSVGFLESADGPTGILFGFFSQLRMICQDPLVNSNKIVVFFDSKKSYRSKVYPEYKRNRRKDKTDEEKEQISLMWDQVKLLRKKILPDMGVQCLSQKGLESDDLIAHASQSLLVEACFGDPDNTEKAVIITSDGDLYQCIHPRCHWYDQGRRKYYDPETFQTAKGIHPGQWGTVKTIAGCSSDNVAGVVGVGEKSAIQFLQGTLPKEYKRYQAIISEQGKEIRERNKELVVLPHPKTKPFEMRAPVYNVDAFFEYCERYALLSFLNKRGGWKRFFLGNAHQVRKRGEKKK